MRPTHVDVVEMWEHEDGTIESWLDIDGHVHAHEMYAATITNRKLVYGLARLVHEVVDGVHVATTIEDIHPVNDEQVYRLVFAELLDHFEEGGFDWRDKPYPTPHSKGKAPKGASRRADVEKRHPVASHRPNTMQRPHTRIVHKDAAGGVLRVDDEKGV